jgi:hypothetical protein
MSLNKTLDRLFDEIRREAKRNPEFADRLDAALRAHGSRRQVDETAIEAFRAEVEPKPQRRVSGAPTQPSQQAKVASAPPLNPVGFYKRVGEDALKALLAERQLEELRALVGEHNLDPGGVTDDLSRDDLAEHILSQAKRRAERDDKMFDY